MAAAKRFDVVGLGQCSFDILGRISEFPEPDQKTELDELIFQGGGPVATALVALSRLGIACSFCGRTGDDDFGRQIHTGLLDENIDCQNLLIDAGKTSQTAFIVVSHEGQRNIFWTRGSARPLQECELDSEQIIQSRVLHLDGLHREASLAAVRIARAHGVTTVLDGGSVRAGTFDLLPYIDHLVVSEKFAEQVHYGGSIADKLEALGAYGAKAVTITLGSVGSWTRERGGQPFHQPVFPVEAVDTTGCGDVFHGGYIYGLLQGWALAVIVRFAAACAALKTQQLGGRTAIPYLDQINDIIYLNKNI